MAATKKEKEIYLLDAEENPDVQSASTDDKGCSTVIEKDDAADVNSKPKARDANVLAAYLREIRKWPLLSRDEEQIIARTLSEAEFRKKILTEKWIIIFTNFFSTKDFNFLKKNSPESLAWQLLLPAKALMKIINIRNTIKAIENDIAKADMSYYRRKKLGREKTGYLLEMQDRINRLNLIKLYKYRGIKNLRPFINKNLPVKSKIELIHILRQLLCFDKQSKAHKQSLARANLRLVVGIAKKYINRGLPLSDLIQEGNIGLLKAIEKFDYRLGYRLSTYASWWIRQTIIRSIEDKSSTIRVPVYINEKIKRISKSSENDYHSGEADEGQNDDTGSDNLLLTLQAIKDPVSLETPFGEDGCNLHECIPDNMPLSPMNHVLKYQFVEQTDELLKSLPPRDEKILRLRFGIGVDAEQTLQEVGEILGISRERIRQLETAALRKIRATKYMDDLRPFLVN